MVKPIIPQGVDVADIIRPVLKSEFGLRQARLRYAGLDVPVGYTQKQLARTKEWQRV